MRAYLNRIGYRAYPWRLGVNDANVEALLPTVTELVRRLANQHQHPVALTGWSNGGIIAREVARDRPDLVSRVFTYGTPIIGGPRYTIGARMYPQSEIERLEKLIKQRNLTPITVPVTAFWSRRDGIVAWRSCHDPDHDHVEHIEVRSSHLGMTVDPFIWKSIANRLAKHRDQLG
jgi:dienelactone hydrolase